MLMLPFIAADLAAVPIDGVYTGMTSQTKSISITVSGGNITEYTLGWSCGGSSGTTTVTSFCPVAADDTFSCGNASCSFIPFNLRTEISGVFAGAAVSGMIDLSFYPCISGCSCCFANGVTFTASLPAPTISINDVIITEGDAGTTVAQFEISRSFDAGEIVSVDWQTSDSTADSSDYQPVSGTAMFLGSQLTEPISVDVFGDTDVETDEVFFVDLSNPQNATIADGQGRCTIKNDDGPPLPPVILVLGISDFDSIDGFDDGDNDVLVRALGPGAVMTGVGWDLNLESVGASWLSEARLYFDGADQDGSGLILTPGAGDDFAGTGSYSSPLIDLTDNGIPDIPILADGDLLIQFYEAFDDVAGATDANYVVPSTVTIEFVPSLDFVFADGFETSDFTQWDETIP